jgi:hypothetical protein
MILDIDFNFFFICFIIGIVLIFIVERFMLASSNVCMITKLDPNATYKDVNGVCYKYTKVYV